MGDIYRVIGVINAAPTLPATVFLVVGGATKRCWLKTIHFGSQNGAALAGATVSIGRPTTSGTGGAAYTPLADDTNAPAAIFTALSASTVFSAEPTQPATYIWRQSLDVVASYIFNAQEVSTDPRGIMIPVSGRLAFRVEADNSATKVLWTATATIEE